MTVTELCSPSGPAAFSSAEGQTMLSFAALCNNSTLSGGLDRPSAAGEPTEVALVLAAANSGKRKNLLELSFPRVREIPFDSGRKLIDHRPLFGRRPVPDHHQGRPRRAAAPVRGLCRGAGRFPADRGQAGPD